MRWLALLLLAAPVAAQDAQSLNAADFVAVRIDGQLNMRAGPTTDAERLMRLANGTLLRRIECRAEADGDWCEVETIDGATEGWAAARFLVPWRGANPSALSDILVQADGVGVISGPGVVSSKLGAGEILDFRFEAPADRMVRVALEAADGIASVIFATDGSALAEGDGETGMAVVSPEGGDLIIRVADMSGTGGNWTLYVRVD